MINKSEQLDVSQNKNPAENEVLIEKGTNAEKREKKNPDNSKEILISDENNDEICKSLLDRVQAEYRTAQRVSDLANLSDKKDDSLEVQVENMRTLVNMAFIKKENSRQGEGKFLNRLYNESVNGQDFVNYLLREDGLYFDSKGKVVGLGDYLKDYYQDLIGDEFDVSIEENFIDNFEYIKNDKEIRDGIEQIKLLESMGKAMPTLVLIDRKRGEKKTIPIVCASNFLENIGAYATYAYIKEGDKSIQDKILVRPVGKIGGEEKSMPEVVGSFIHEIDHAVYNFLHESDSKRYERELAKTRNEMMELKNSEKNIEKIGELDDQNNTSNALSEKRMGLEMQIMTEELIKGMNKRIVFEGLARQSQRSFIKSQIEGLSDYSLYTNGFRDGAMLLIDENKIDDQINMQMLFYSCGDILVSDISDKINKNKLYKTDELEKKIINNPNLIKTVIRQLVLNCNQTVAEINKIRKEQKEILSDDKLKLIVRHGMGSLRVPFILGKEYFDILLEIDENVDKKDLLEIKEGIKKLTDKNPSMAQEILNKYQNIESDIDIARAALKKMQISMGKLKERADEEFDKIFEKTEDIL